MAAEQGRPRFVIADDLSGAADTAVHFGGRRPVRLTFAPGPPWDLALDAGTVQVHDTESRSLPAEAAGERVAAAAAELVRPGEPPPVVYKKVDSTLRGPVGAELAALLDVLGRRLLVLAPALPGQGRRVVDGRLLVGDRPHDRVAEVVRHTWSGPIAEIRLADLRRPAPALTQRLVELRRTHRIAIVDAETDGDLDTIARAVAADPALLPAGSSGLAAAIARLDGGGEPGSAPPPRRAHVLVVAGSHHPVAQEQLAKLLAAMPRVPVVSAAAGPADPRHVEAAIALAVADRAAELRSGGWTVVATGGATALAVCRALDIRALRPRGEVLPGVPWSEAEGSRLLLVTKAGGFGEPAALVEAVRRLLAETAVEARVG